MLGALLAACRLLYCHILMLLAIFIAKLVLLIIEALQLLLKLFLVCFIVFAF